MTPRNPFPRFNKRSARPKARQAGAALLAAMLTVTLVATLAAAALWQQWRAVEVEEAERARMQSAWILIGGLDWSRLILREDGRTGGPDTLTEVWAFPLEEARLSSFLSAQKNVSSADLEGLPDALLSGRIVDAQSKLNVRNLVGANNKPDPAALASFKKLFALLGLPVGEVDLLASGVQRATAGITTVTTTTPAPTTAGAATDTSTTPATTTTTTTTTVTTSTSAGDDGQAPSVPLMPVRTSQLVWLGLSPQTVAALEPYVTVLPAANTRLNINTASAEAIYASVPEMDMATAKQVVARRTLKSFTAVKEADSVLRDQADAFTDQRHSVGTSYFEVEGKLRLDNTFVEEHSLLNRNGINVTVLWRERGAGATLTAAPR
ncbi:type II secretion system minor pseudopilin GspK [Variovorax robiniae]|uniref:Type II secretion system minor pseudopilin GspK n=1 Tax=Variovorax robiniae TaxID=1836199 RepID=A0ABU8X3U1_9BURK